jgi:soluble lytic murein transglycosylase-like protein
VLKSALTLCLLMLTLVFQSQPAAADQDEGQAPDPELRSALEKAVNASESFNDRFEAEVWLLDMSGRLQKRMEDEQERLEFLRQVHAEATRARLPPELVLALIQVESNFDRYAVSRVGAQGFMQVMPFWVKEIGRPDDNLIRTSTNLRYGCTILRHYMDRENGNWVRALARYNGSLGRTVYPDKVMNALQRQWFNTP